MRAVRFAFHLPRHPLLRALVAVAGIVLVAGMLALGLVVGAAVLAAAALAMAIRRWTGRARRPRSGPDVIDGEFTVLQRPRAALPPQDPATTTKSGW